ncbi:hypothetical protein CVT26_003530 [Gymnopilus dilepis]|uniref:Endoplasmic reticulum vesicle transporter N-terminal domain-containing protein n=1 Tax=Gymnopilus dilepis TaxID=231916 RepID=A0A409WR49_9AGAR|nr:hypothetical protein CVT26_003530 [Gymnopilus dilepis]
MASTPTSHTNGSGEPSLLDKLDAVAPLAKLDAFPKVPSTYKTRSESRGFMTLFVAFLAFLLILNDVGEFIWGWPDYEFSVDGSKSNYLNINLDMVVAMPCGFLSVDLRDAMGDRLYLSGGLRRDGPSFPWDSVPFSFHARLVSSAYIYKAKHWTRRASRISRRS